VFGWSGRRPVPHALVQRLVSECEGRRFTQVNIHIPDTVIFKSHRPAHWYFTSKKTGEIMKKKDESLNYKEIIKEFLKDVGKSGIVAYFF
jgi:uncharacterized protein YcnI